MKQLISIRNTMFVLLGQCKGAISMNLLLFMFSGAFVCHSVSAQKPEINDASFKKIGIGVGYGYRPFVYEGISKDLVDDITPGLNPVEISFLYRLSPRHGFYFTIPWMIRTTSNVNDRFHSAFLDKSYVDCQYDDQKAYTYGFDAGYDFSFYRYKGLSAFAGLGIGYQRYVVDTEHNSMNDATLPPWENFISALNVTTNAYSLTPQVGLMYEWKCMALEVKYRLYVERLKSALDYNSEFATEPYHFEDKSSDTVFKNGVSVNLFVLF